MPSTGRSIGRYLTFKIGDTGNVLRTIALNSVGGLGLTYPAKEVSAWSDAVKGVLLETPDFSVEIGGPFDTTAHGYLSALNGGNMPRTFDFQFGIQTAWDAGEPQFGVSQSAVNGGLLTDYQVDIGNGTWKAKLYMFAGSVAPEWNTIAEA